MNFPTPLLLGRLVKRYKRFLADVILDDGRQVTAHIANSGSMLGCAEPGFRVALSLQDRVDRKLKFSWELVEVDGTWVVVNTSRPNHIVAEAVALGRVRPLSGYSSARAEVPYGQGSRIDLLLSKGEEHCYVEVKNVTLRQAGSRRALFPDAVTARGAKHLMELRRMVEAGHRGVIFFLVNRADCTSMGTADHIDPVYGRLLREVAGQGVEILAYRTRADLSGVWFDRKVPVVI